MVAPSVLTCFWKPKSPEICTLSATFRSSSPVIWVNSSPVANSKVTSAPLGKVIVSLTAASMRLISRCNVPSIVNSGTPNNAALPLADKAYLAAFTPSWLISKPNVPSLSWTPTASDVPPPLPTNADTSSAPMRNSVRLPTTFFSNKNSPLTMVVSAIFNSALPCTLVISPSL